MTIKDMLVLLDNGPRVDARSSAEGASLGPAATAALELAARIGAHVTAVALAVDPIVPGFVVAPLPVEVIEQARTQAIAVADAAAAAFTAEATRLGVPHETRVSEILMGGVPEGFAAAARTTDLVVIGQDDPDHPEPMREAMIETALFEGAAPTLLVTGDADTVNPPGVSQALADRIKGAVFSSLDRCGHWATVECPRESGQKLADFLRRVDR